MKITCIICPKGCQIETDGKEMTGNGCPRGREYAIRECLNPVRTVTAVLPVSNRPGEYVSVKTAAPIPKEKIFELMDILHETKANAPVRLGDSILKTVFGTDVVATKTVK